MKNDWLFSQVPSSLCIHKEPCTNTDFSFFPSFYYKKRVLFLYSLWAELLSWCGFVNRMLTFCILLLINRQCYPLHTENTGISKRAVSPEINSPLEKISHMWFAMAVPHVYSPQKILYFWLFRLVPFYMAQSS